VVKLYFENGMLGSHVMPKVWRSAKAGFECAFIGDSTKAFLFLLTLTLN